MSASPRRGSVNSPARFVPLAEVARPHGIAGELRLKVYNADSDLLERRPPLRLRFPDGTERDGALRTVRAANKALLVTLDGVGDRNAAEAMRGVVLCVARDLFPPLEEGEFYACDVEGARAVLSTGEEIGRVAELRSYPTCDVLVVERAGATSLEVPLVESYIASVDAEQGVVTLRTIDGLGG